jgi:hypothetical protein
VKDLHKPRVVIALVFITIAALIVIPGVTS